MDKVQVNLLQNMGRTCCVQKLFWMPETISVHNMFSPGLSLEFSCIELVIQWTNLSSYCGLVDAKIRASDKDLPVLMCPDGFSEKLLCKKIQMHVGLHNNWIIDYQNRPQCFVAHSCRSLVVIARIVVHYGQNFTIFAQILWCMCALYIS